MADERRNPLEIMNDPDAHPKHRQIAAINARIMYLGEHWAKCANCGELYEINEEWSDGTVCGPICYKQYVEYLSNPDPGWMHENEA